MDKNVVWEHKTRGTRFMTFYKKGKPMKITNIIK